MDDFSQMYFDEQKIELDFKLFTQQFTKTFYYDSLPPKKDSESQEVYKERTKDVETLFEKLQMLDNFHVYLGNAHHRRKRIEQKQVDMMIAIDMLKHAFNKNMHKATLLTSDSDFIPLLDTLVENGMHINLWYGNTINCKTSKELLMAADGRMKISIQHIYSYTNRIFKEKFRIPTETGNVNPTYTNLLNKWMDPLKGEIQLYKDGDLYILILPNKNNNIQIDLISHDNFDLLKVFCREEYNIDIPERSVAQ